MISSTSTPILSLSLSLSLLLLLASYSSPTDAAGKKLTRQQLNYFQQQARLTARSETIRDVIADMRVKAKALNLPANPRAALRLYNGSGKAMPYGAASWDSVAPNSNFTTGPCIKVSGIHMAQTVAKTIIITDRNDKQNGYLYFPNKQLAYAEELNLVTGTQRPLDVISNTFCSTGAFLPDGTLVSVGGTQLPNQKGIADGFSVRALTPCNDGNCFFQLAGNLTTKRWYPTAQLLPEGRVLMMGGSFWGRFINGAGYNNPSFEYWPLRKPTDGSFNFQFLVKTMPYNLYPFVHLLPSGNVFVFASHLYTVLNTTSNAEVKSPMKTGYPPLYVTDSKGQLIYRNYPAPGTSFLFPLGSRDNYTAQIMICGGNTAQTARAGYFNLAIMPPADDKCWRIIPESPNATWVMERMCLDPPTCNISLPRVMGDSVLLADGTMLLLNGAAGGYSGIPNAAVNATLTPLIYNPYNQTWFTERLATSFIPRLYHASTVLLHDATVIVTGSNPSQGVDIKTIYYPTDFRTEFFYPPYFFKGLPSPILTYSPSKIGAATTFTICFTSVQKSTKASSFRVVMAHPGFSTHGNRHGMRHIDLDIASLQSVGTRGGFTATIKSPPSLAVAPPTFYWLYLLDNGVPNREGIPIFMAMDGSSLIASAAPLPVQCLG